MVKWIIYTDLDGTLLDFETYSYREAETTVERLRKRDIPLVFCSSKTRVEQEVYRQVLRLRTPFIVENGSAILVPQGYFSFNLQAEEALHPYEIRDIADHQVILLGEPAEYIRNTIAEARAEVGTQARGYADLSQEEIMQLTGLDKYAALRAAQRDYSETLLLSDAKAPAWHQFLQLLDAKGLQCVSGGKFYTVMGKGSDKGKAVSLLNTLFRREYGKVSSVGLGDSANDLPLLKAVDKPFLVQKPSGQWQEVQDERIRKVAAIGPKGFNQALHSLLKL